MIIQPPFITEKTDAERVKQIEDYLELLVNQLNEILNKKDE